MGRNGYKVQYNQQENRNNLLSYSGDINHCLKVGWQKWKNPSGVISN